ncbi:metallopeptidase TldD-related protein [Streptomyces sp. NPDC021224]|uniref:metallopeptidase TldD-related protein n=1 Tax=unclassified Streptomyces TaxID=2593676 RepID=UPI0037904046
MTAAGATRTVVFAETAARTSRAYAPGLPVRQERTVRRGMCVETHTAAGGMRHAFADGAALLGAPVPRLSPPAAAEARRAVTALPPEVCAAADRALRERARGDVRIVWSRYWQRVAAGAPELLRADTRSLCTAEVQLLAASHDARGGAALSVAVPWDVSRPEESAAALDAAVARLREAAALPGRPLPRRPCPVVLDAGHAGAFFHELVGHPLEADAVLGRSSYLARRPGERVAPGWFTVDDGEGGARGGVSARFDDEGTAVRQTRLIDAGRVAHPLTDTASAALLGTPGSGHGRRLDYRHCVLPRMRHTVASANRPAAAPPAPLPSGVRLHPRGLQLRWMNILSGDFEFAAADAILVQDGAVTARTGPVRLTGTGLHVLAALRPADTHPAACGARATKGCGKLDQFPLPVSFANSTLWLPEGVLRADTPA